MGNKKATIDKSKELRIEARVNEAGVPITFTFLDEDGVPYSITSLDFSLIVKKAPTSTTNIFELTIGDGLTVVNDEENGLTVSVSDARATVLPNSYFWTLYSNSENHTWLNGVWEFHAGTYDGVCPTSQTITVGASGTPVEITISAAGIESIEIDGGSAASVYLLDQVINGGDA